MIFCLMSSLEKERFFFVRMSLIMFDISLRLIRRFATLVAMKMKAEHKNNLLVPFSIWKFE